MEVENIVVVQQWGVKCIGNNLCDSSSPSPYPVLMIATPPSFNTVSHRWSPGWWYLSKVMMSNTLCGDEQCRLPFQGIRTLMSEYTSRRRSLLITSGHPCLAHFFHSRPSAWSIFLLPSNRNGMNHDTYGQDFHVLSRFGNDRAAPVPFHPIIPAVMKTMRHPSFSIFLMSSMLSSAAARALAGRFPAPSPSPPELLVPEHRWFFQSLVIRVCRPQMSSWIPSLYMWLTALPPPPTNYFYYMESLSRNRKVPLFRLT